MRDRRRQGIESRSPFGGFSLHNQGSQLHPAPRHTRLPQILEPAIAIDRILRWGPGLKAAELLVTAIPRRPLQPAAAELRSPVCGGEAITTENHDW